MSLFWKQYKEYIIPLLIGGFGIALVVYGIVPAQQKIRKLMDTSQEILTDREIREELVASLVTLREQKDLVQKNEEVLHVVIPKENIVDLIKNIEDLARNTHNEISIDAQTLNVAPPPVTKPKKEAVPAKNEAGETADTEVKKTEKTLIDSLPSDKRIGISIKLTGSYNDIVQFIQKLESMPYATDIIALSFTVEEPDADSAEKKRADIFASSTPMTTDQSATPAEGAPAPQAPEPPKDLLIQAKIDTVIYVDEN